MTWRAISLFGLAGTTPPPPNLAADVVVYGATPSGIIAAIAARRHGRSVLLVGGWRESRLGGMMTSGLGESDVNKSRVIGGIPLEFFQRVTQAYGLDELTTNFGSPVAQDVFDAWVAEEDVPVIWSRGVVSAAKEGASLVRFGTRCGLSIAGRVFIDASYEGDLLRVAGASLRTGREPASEFDETYAGRIPQMSPHSFAGVLVDPFRVPGVPVSGLLPTVRYPSTALGEGDQTMQAFNFRLSMVRGDASRSMPLPTAPPPDYNPLRYELLLRYIASLRALGRPLSPESFLNISAVPGALLDVNAKSAFGTDDFGGSAASYVAAGMDYGARQRAWKDTESFIRGLLWTYWGHRDPRMPQALREQMRDIRFAAEANLKPYPGDAVGWPPYLYVREHSRLRGVMTLTEHDCFRSDDVPVPYADQVIAESSYIVDRHHVQRLAVEYAPGMWRVENEGGFFLRHGGANEITPLPWGICVPRPHELTNVVTCWSVSVTSVAWGLVRMEPSAMCVGHACGTGAALMTAGSATTSAQALSVSELRAALRQEGARIDRV